MKMNQWFLTAGVAAALGVGASHVLAQNTDSNNNNGGQQGRRGRGGPPTAEQMQQYQQERMNRYKTELEIADDAEWKAIQPLVQKVQEARTAVMTNGMGFGRGMFGRGPGGPDNRQGDQGQRRSFGGNNPDADALQKAIEAKASNADLKAATAKYQEARKARQAEVEKAQANLEKAQANLRKVLSVRQEAIATLHGLL
jgi:hypothetical protein